MGRTPAKLTWTLLMALAACSGEAPPGSNTGADAGGTTACDQDNPCGAGLVCRAGICESATPDAGTDAGPGPQARMQVCTPEGCEEPLRMNFGGSRIGATVQQTLTIRSIGDKALELRNLDILSSGTEFQVDPGGELNATLAPGEEMAFRVTHTAADGVADNEQLQIITSADLASRVLVQLVTEYKGVPSLFVGSAPDTNTNEVITLDFGNVRVGVPETRTLYLKNKDRIIDGSVLAVDEVRLDPSSSTNFQLTVDRALPAALNQFNSLCASDANCDGATCDVGLGVCVGGDGALVDVMKVEVSFIGTNPGRLEEALVVLSNDGGMGRQPRTISLRANATFSQLQITPDPVTFPEGYIGFPEQQTVTLTNPGTAPLVITDVALVETSTFTLDLGATPLPWTIDPMASVTFAVAYAPPAVGAHATELLVTSDDTTNPVSRVTVSGNGLVAPQLRLQPGQVDFGDTHVMVGGQPSATQQVTIHNDGGSELRVPSIVRSAATSVDFTVDPASVPPIPPGGNATFNVRYGPAVASFPNTQSGLVELTNNDPRTRPIAGLPLSGRGVNPNALVLPASQINFNTLPANPNNPNIFWAQTLEGQVSVVNSGLGPMVVSAISIVGDARNAYSLVGPPGLPATVPAGQNIILTARYSAPGQGTDGATLQLVTNDLDLPGGLVSIALVGSTSLCPARNQADGLANAAGACQYTCRTGYVDLDGDLVNPSSNGCEYLCTITNPVDVPDDNFLDTNCDGIDGDPANAVFVAPPPFGNPANPGTRALPISSLVGAITVAQGTGRDVYVSDGNYTGTLDLVNGVSMYGGYSASTNWSRSNSARSTIQGQGGTGVRAFGISSPTVFDRFEVLSGDAQPPSGSGPGLNAIGIEVRSSNANLLVSNNRITPGAGSPGTAGTGGGSGSNGLPGSRGGDGGETNGCAETALGNGGGGGGSFGGAQGAPAVTTPPAPPASPAAAPAR